MPAAAVIPAPIAYINVVAVKKLVVEFLGGPLCLPSRVCTKNLGPLILLKNLCGIQLSCTGIRYFTLKKLECFRQAIAGIH